MLTKVPDKTFPHAGSQGDDYLLRNVSSQHDTTRERIEWMGKEGTIETRETEDRVHHSQYITPPHEEDLLLAT